VLHATAAGRAWLTTLDEDEAVGVVQKKGFSIPTRFNPSTVTDERTLRAELGARIRARERGGRSRDGSDGFSDFRSSGKEVASRRNRKYRRPDGPNDVKADYPDFKGTEGCGSRIFSDMANAAFR